MNPQLLRTPAYNFISSSLICIETFNEVSSWASSCGTVFLHEGDKGVIELILVMWVGCLWREEGGKLSSLQQLRKSEAAPKKQRKNPKAAATKAKAAGK